MGGGPTCGHASWMDGKSADALCAVLSVQEVHEPALGRLWV